ncbi:tyrosinase family protein [Streptomyces sp. BF23-19]|uniref:tyrosinase family protein n=1 Tax=unclassified Streptomyces TaxID=2593676 RepID=UPI0034E4BF86
MTRAIDRRDVLKLGVLVAGSTLGVCPSAMADGPSCTAIVRRPEVRELNADQWDRFANAVKQLPGPVSGRYYDRAVADYHDNTVERRGVPAFLPWLRTSLRRFEQALNRVDPSVGLPYWDWSKDYQTPGQSPLLSASYFGGTGRPSDGTVIGGSFAHWKCTLPDAHELRRSGRKVPSMPSPEEIESVLARSDRYDSLRASLEQHFTSVLKAIGGQAGDLSTNYAPNDPLFWVIAGFTDLLWAEWQQRRPALSRTYNGQAGGKNVSPNDTLQPFKVPVSSTLDIRAPGFCYYYSRWSARP